MFGNTNIVLEIVVVIVSVTTVIVLSGVFKAYLALWMGDPTPKINNGTSFNPKYHIDLMSLLCFILFKFGWSTHHPVNLNNFKDRFWGRIIYSLGGILVNFFISLIALILLYYLNDEISAMILTNIAMVGVVFGIFDLIPLPPSETSIFISAFLPADVEREYFQFSKYTSIIFMILIVTGGAREIIGPTYSYIISFLYRLSLMLVL